MDAEMDDTPTLDLLLRTLPPLEPRCAAGSSRSAAVYDRGGADGSNRRRGWWPRVEADSARCKREPEVEGKTTDPRRVEAAVSPIHRADESPPRRDGVLTADIGVLHPCTPVLPAAARTTDATSPARDAPPRHPASLDTSCRGGGARYTPRPGTAAVSAVRRAARVARCAAAWSGDNCGASANILQPRLCVAPSGLLSGRPATHAFTRAAWAVTHAHSLERRAAAGSGEAPHPVTAAVSVGANVERQLHVAAASSSASPSPRVTPGTPRYLVTTAA